MICCFKGPLIFEVGGISHPPYHGASTKLYGEVSRESVVYAHLHTAIVDIYIVNESFAIFNTKQTIFRTIITDANNDLVEYGK